MHKKITNTLMNYILREYQELIFVRKTLLKITPQTRIPITGTRRIAPPSGFVTSYVTIPSKDR